MTAALVHTVAELRGALAGAPRPWAVVPTMGALHPGHVELVAAARRQIGPGGTVVVTVFVNPTQFGPGEDLSRYPRTLAADVAAATRAGADYVFAPDAVEMYGPSGGFRPDSVTVDPGPLGDILEGAARPGHFRGTLTIVTKLLSIVGADVATFGEKDYQQLVLVSRLVADLDLATRIVPVPTVREPDGLALSSRNRFLSTAERRAATALPRALTALTRAAVHGRAAALAAGRRVLDAESGIEVDYLVLTDPRLGPAPPSGPARALVAARVGTTRLIDNEGVVIR